MLVYASFQKNPLYSCKVIFYLMSCRVVSSKPFQIILRLLLLVSFKWKKWWRTCLLKNSISGPGTQQGSNNHALLRDDIFTLQLDYKLDEKLQIFLSCDSGGGCSPSQLLHAEIAESKWSNCFSINLLHVVLPNLFLNPLQKDKNGKKQHHHFVSKGTLLHYSLSATDRLWVSFVIECYSQRLLHWLDVHLLSNQMMWANFSDLALNLLLHNTLQ